MQKETTTIQGFILPSYFITGKIPYGASVSPKDSLSDLALVGDCLNACGVLLSINNPPPSLLLSIKKAAHLLGADDLVEKFPDHLIGGVFIAYMKRSGLK